MEQNAIYKCNECGKTATGSDTEAPVCCGVPMEKLPPCRLTDTAEHARAESKNDPCDDGRAGA